MIFNIALGTFALTIFVGGLWFVGTAFFTLFRIDGADHVEHGPRIAAGFVIVLITVLLAGIANFVGQAIRSFIAF